MNLYEMIGRRKSVREYQMKPIDEKVLAAIRKYLKEILPLYPDIPYEIEISCSLEEKKAGILSVNAPYYVSFLTKESKEAYLNAGYIMEELSLYLASRGIGTCYQGIQRIVKEQGELKEVLVMAMGYPKHYLYREEADARRIELNRLSAFKEEPTKEIMTILKAASLTPSSLNSQPWRFVVYKNRIHVFMQKLNAGIPILEKLHYIDVGMALNHMMIAAEELWVEAELAESEHISSHSFRRNTYITSLLLK